MNSEAGRKFKMIFTDADLKRIKYVQSDGGITMMVDVHGMKCSQAKRFLNNIINLLREHAHLVVIHGYNHGTAIKEMLTNNFENSHITDKYLDWNNLGVTHMMVY